MNKMFIFKINKKSLLFFINVVTLELAQDTHSQDLQIKNCLHFSQ